MRRVYLLLISIVLWTGSAEAVPETVSVRVTDVTTSSFAVVWLTDVAAEPVVEVYADASMSRSLAGAVEVTPMPDTSPAVAVAARGKGIMKVRVAGLSPGTTCWVRTVTRDPVNPASVSFSSLREVTTAASVVSYRREADGTVAPAGNDLLSFNIYIRPSDTAEMPGLGDLLLLETAGAIHPVSVFVGEGTVAPEGILDLNNLFGLDGSSLDVQGGEVTLLRIYRGGTLSSLLHYRRFPTDSGLGAVGVPVQGFFADINLDGKVDEQDFAAFKEQYRQVADDVAFNPDYNFFPAEAGKTVAGDKVDARDFARFATEFGRADLE